mmetsp:Transcript_57715/g.137334  ORF Transcript_57715/g.137334 Transcript_57715/m.137334 type:complete len:720 (+) Transcript_57715:125-2284(+)
MQVPRVRGIFEPTTEAPSPPISTPPYPEACLASGRATPGSASDGFGGGRPDRRASLLTTSRRQSSVEELRVDVHSGEARLDGTNRDSAGDYVHVSADVCHACGNHFLDDALFCRKCGARRQPKVAASAVSVQQVSTVKADVRSVIGGASSVPTVMPARTLPARSSLLSATTQAVTTQAPIMGVTRSSSAGHVGSVVRAVTPSPPQVAHVPAVVPLVKEIHHAATARPSVVMERQPTTRVVEPPVQVQTLRKVNVPLVTPPVVTPQPIAQVETARRISAVVIEPPVTVVETGAHVIASPSTTESPSPPPPPITHAPIVLPPSPAPEVAWSHKHEERITSIVNEKVADQMRIHGSHVTSRSDSLSHRLEQDIADQCGRVKRDLEEQIAILRKEVEGLRSNLRTLTSDHQSLRGELHLHKDQLEVHLGTLRLRDEKPVVLDAAARQDASSALAAVATLQQTVNKQSERMENLNSELAAASKGSPSDSLASQLQELRAEIELGSSRKEQTFSSRFDALDREVKSLRANLMQRPWETSSPPAASQEAEQLLRTQRERLQVLAGELSEAQRNCQATMQSQLAERFEQERKVREAQYDGLHGLIKGQRCMLDDARSALGALEQLVQDHRQVLTRDLEDKCRSVAQECAAVTRDLRDNLQASVQEVSELRVLTEAGIEERLHLLESFHDSAQILFRDGLKPGWTRRRKGATAVSVTSAQGLIQDQIN